MGASAAIAASGFLLKKANDYNNKTRTQGMSNALQSGKEAAAVLTPPTLPDPPSTLASAADAANAMTAAANRYRKQRGGGFGSTILTGPLGSTTPAPTARKSLLGV